jgi:hypothetical protein
MTETPSEMAHRHVREGQERIDRQRAVIATLEAHGDKHMLPYSWALLNRLIVFQREAEKLTDCLTRNDGCSHPP